ncbi:sensor histidine kinase [Leucobacter luti]|uniref:sensor histidine kinase n=1 Tax=Leucobacter luti TaxID=340320 RepID=UPI003D062883
MTGKSEQTRPALGAASAVWIVAVLVWLYYLTPIVSTLLTGREPAKVVLMIAPPAIALALLAIRRRFALAAVLGIGAMLVLGPGAIGAAIAMQASLARRDGRPLPVLLAGLWFAAAKLANLLIGPFSSPWATPHTVELTFALVGLAFATLVGWLLRTIAAEQRGRASAAQARVDAEAARIEQARLAERERIAREMHDVLAHRLSLVSMNAGILAFRDDLSPEETRETARMIQSGTRQSLDELRAVLSTLRGADAPPAPPQPTLADLPVLVAELDGEQRVELDVDVAAEGGLVAVPPQLGRHAYRIVQEALTNARKHAPGAPVAVEVSGEPGGALVIRASNPLSELVIPDPDRGAGSGGAAGFGLLGVSERAASMGGSAEYGPVGGRYVLTATIPWNAEPRSAEQ